MGRWQPLDWYDEARAYDVVFDAGTRDEADFLEAGFARYARGAAAEAGRRGRAPSALEPACGTGRLVVEMAARGWAVTGYDLNAGALAYARNRLKARGLRATLHCDAMQRWRRRRRFDLAYNLVSSFKYLASDEDAVAHLGHVAAMLRPGGPYLLGLHLTDYEDRSRHRERWRARRDGLDVTAVIETGVPDRRGRTEAMRARLTVRPEGGGEPRRFETTWTFRTWGPRQLRRVLDAVPALELVAVHDFTYRLDRPVRYGGEQLDHLLVLRRRNV